MSRMAQKPSEKEQAKQDEIDKITAEVNYKRYHPEGIPDALFGGEPNELVGENINLKKQLAQYEDDRTEKIEAYERLYDEAQAKRTQLTKYEGEIEKLKKINDNFMTEQTSSLKEIKELSDEILKLNKEVKKLKTSNTKLKKALTDAELT